MKAARILQWITRILVATAVIMLLWTYAANAECDCPYDYSCDSTCETDQECADLFGVSIEEEGPYQLGEPLYVPPCPLKPMKLPIDELSCECLADPVTCAGQYDNERVKKFLMEQGGTINSNE